MLKVGEPKSLDARVEDELKGITEMVLGWPSVLISLQNTIQEATKNRTINQTFLDEAERLRGAVFSKIPEVQKTLGDYARILEAYSNVRTTKRTAKYTGLLAIGTFVLASATVMLALASLFQVHL